jgi:hypothetical protein
MAAVQAAQVNKVRTMIAGAAHSDAPGERKFVADMARSCIERYGLKRTTLFCSCLVA